MTDLDGKTVEMQSDRCARCSRVIETLYRRCGLVGAWNDPRPAHLPDGAEQYLHWSNPRLNALRAAYGSCNMDGAGRSLWTPEYVQADVPLTAFRGDCAYLWQTRDSNLPVNYLLTYYYLSTVGGAELIASLGEDGAFGAQTLTLVDGLRISRDLMDSVSEILFLEQLLQLSRRQGDVVLDIGSGYGRFAHRIVSAYPQLGGVVCVDAVPESTFICEYYLNFRHIFPQARAVPLPEIESALAAAPVYLATSISCFSECPQSAVKWWMTLLREHSVPYLFIVPNASDAGGTQLFSREPDGTRGNLTEMLSFYGYELRASRAKYPVDAVQRCGVSPSHYFLFEFSR